MKKNNITTIGQLANLDVKTVVQLKVKPPKVQTVKIVLAAYHSKIKKEENTFRKGTPVQEETSQEEEERIKEALFSNPTPSPDKDMLGDQDTATEAKEQKQIDHSEGDTKGDTEGDIEDDKEGVTEADKEADTEVVTEEAAVDKEKDNSDVHQGEELVEEETTGKDETTRRANTIPAEATAENSAPLESSVKFIPETESLSPVKTNCSEASEELKNCDENEAGPVKPTFIVEEMEVGDRDVEAAETIEKSVETEQDEEAAKLVEDEKNEEEEQKEPSSDVNEKMGEKKEEAPVHEEDKMKEASNQTPSAAPVTDIMAVLNDTELNLSVQSTKDLIELYERFSSHQKEVDQFKDNISKILFGRMK